jgi:hypothetical protein
MKIILIQEAGQHKENATFKEALCFQRAFERLGIKTIVAGPGYQQDIKTVQLQHEDILLVLQNYDLEWIPNLTLHKGLKFFWSIDSHKNKLEHLKFCHENKIDTVFVSTKNDVSYFKEIGQSLWFPNCFPADLMRPLYISKNYYCGFCGNYGNRKEWLLALVRLCHLKTDIMVLGASMVRAINSYGIHWNRNEADDINGRTFETLGCGTLLLTNETPGIHELFDDGKHIVIYNTIGDCCEKIRYYSNHPSERMTIARAGNERALKYHTFDARAQFIVDLLNRKG